MAELVRICTGFSKRVRGPESLVLSRLFQATTAPSAVVSLESGSGTVYTNVSPLSRDAWVLTC